MFSFFSKKTPELDNPRIRSLRRLLADVEQPHGTVDGRTHCQEGRSELAYLRDHGHGCTRCIAHEKLALVDAALSADVHRSDSEMTQP